MNNADIVKRIPKHVYLPYRLVELGESKARKIGYTLTKYLEYLLAKDVEKEALGVEILDESVIIDVAKGLADVKKGRMSELLETEDDIDRYFEKLSK